MINKSHKKETDINEIKQCNALNIDNIDFIDD